MKRRLLFLLLFIAGLSRHASAQCTSNAGTVTNPGNYTPCSNEGQSIFNANAVLDANDIKRLVLHTGTASQVGTVVYNTQFTWVGFNSTTMATGVTYQIAYLVGNDAGNGQVDLSDPCLSIASGGTITFVTAPTLTVTQTGAMTCGQLPLTLTANVEPQGPTYTYQWLGQGAVGTNPTYDITQPGTYYLFATDVVTGCYAGDTLVITGDNTIPTAQIGISNALCNEATFTANTNNPANTFLWSNGLTAASINVDATGSYCVTISSPQGCTATACRNFSAGTPLNATIARLGNGNICTDSLSLSAVGSGGITPYTYLWNTGEAFKNLFNIQQSGQYIVTITASNGCTAVASTFVEQDASDCGNFDGRVYADQNNNCVFDAGDVDLSLIPLRLQGPGGVEIITVGPYTTPLPAGVYTVTPVLAVGSPWTPCQPSYTVTVLAAPAPAATVAVGLQSALPCPVMEVNVHVPFLRRCFLNTFSVRYCNLGSGMATGAYVDITLEPGLTFYEASIPYTDLGNGQYRFQVGDVDIEQCGNFWFKAKADCNADLGQTLCAEATVYPNEPCGQALNWSGASVKLSAECTGNEVIFRAKNIGNSDMSSGLEYVIIEDAVMLAMPPGTPLLQNEERVLFTAPANGATWRLEATQEPNHPGQSMPSVSVEGCSNGQTFSVGYRSQFETDDADPWVDFECKPIIGSYDPNDKRGFPAGYGQQHYIRPGVDLEYTIRFQNTGTDTAFLVVIRDTLSKWLDPATVRPGASSHPYRFSYYGEGHLKFEFNPIALPDSFANVLGSQGFVSFRVAQRAGVPLETDILNTAAIYFDANAPVITNTTVHRVGENFVTVSSWSPVLPQLGLQVMPNPATDYAIIQLEAQPSDTWQVEVIGLDGQVLRRVQCSGNNWRLDRHDLPAGMYLLRIGDGKQLWGTAKMMLK